MDDYRQQGSIPLSSPANGSCPLTEEHFAIIRQSIANRACVDRTARTARISGKTILAIGLLSLVMSLLSWSVPAVIVTSAICVIGIVELRGAEKLRDADSSACTMLCINQMMFLGVIAAYCAWQMLISPAELQKTLQAYIASNEMRQILQQMPSSNAMVQKLDRLLLPVYYGFYGMVILLSAAFQGGLAIYYSRQKKNVEAYLQTTPDWIRRLAWEMKA